MAEYFGVEMSYLFCDADSWQEYKSTERMGAFEIDKYFSESRATLDGRIWVSDEWNDFFNYRMGDVLRISGNGRDYSEDTGIDDIDDNKTPFNIEFDNLVIVGKDELDYPQILTRSEQKIIMRDNKIFFMPEVENA